ncbi:MAG: hypothetical protein O2812_02375 [Chloroflexi bacterium]|nr:hypothetical protein [Chloroflexota bacterium]
MNGEIDLKGSDSQSRVGLAILLIMLGLITEMVALGIGSYLGVLNGEYWSETKAARDSAAAGSDLLSTGGTIVAVATWLEPLKFVGVAFFFAGIAFALSGIVPRVQARAQAMATAIEQHNAPHTK